MRLSMISRKSKRSLLYLNHRANLWDFGENSDFCENSDEPIPSYHIPERIGKEVDDSMAALAAAETEMKREGLGDFVTNAIEREMACMSMIRLQTEALRAMQEGKIIDVENLMRMEGLSIPGRGSNKEDGKTEVLD